MEDDVIYFEGWNVLVVKNFIMFINYFWKYWLFFDDVGFFFLGEFGVYIGGGYVVDLIGDWERVMKIVYGLMLNNWIN